MQGRNELSHSRVANSCDRPQASRLHADAGLPVRARLGACGSYGETLQRGYVLPEGALEQIPVGATQEQVLIVLGTPSTVATVNGDAFYYISQKAQRTAAFMPHEVVDQRVIAVYFDKERAGRAACRLRHQGRQGFRFLVADHADRRPGTQLHPQHLQKRRHASVGADRATQKGPARSAGPFCLFASCDLSAPARPAAAAPRCW